MLVAGALVLHGCPTPGETPPAGDSSTGPDDTTAAAEDTEAPPPTTGSDVPAIEPWLEVGWGTTEFNAFEGELPVVVGPQGLHMFSMPLRGQGFYNPPDPSFDNPDMPILQAWVDVEGFAITDDGHFNEVVDYPALFYPALGNAAVLEGPAVWLVLPDSVEPEQIEGLSAVLHAEMVDAFGLVLTDEHELVIGEVPPAPGGP